MVPMVSMSSTIVRKNSLFGYFRYRVCTASEVRERIPDVTVLHVRVTVLYVQVAVLYVPDSGRDCLVCAEFARERCPWWA